MWCQLNTLSKCIRRDSRARVTRDEAVRVWLCTLSLRALNPPGNADLKKTIKNQRRQSGETRDPLTRTSWTAKKARHERPRLYESIRGEVSVSIYLHTLTFFRVLSARVYNWHDMVFSLYREYELKILRVNVKLTYLGISFTEKHAGWRLMWLNNIVEIAIFQLFFQLKGSTLQKLLIISKCTLNESYVELYFPQKTQRKQIFISFRSGATGRQTFAIYLN